MTRQPPPPPPRQPQQLLTHQAPHHTQLLLDQAHGNPAAAADPAGGIHWRSVIDNLLIETVASIFINVTAVVYGDLGFDGTCFSQPWMQLVPALATGLVMMTCKDEHYFPPDATPTVTLLLWSLGAYDSWIQAAARLLGHVCGFFVTWLLCRDMQLSAPLVPTTRPGGVIFGSETLATVVEHFAVVYLFLPLLPPNYSHSARYSFPSIQPKARAKSSPQAVPPSNATVLHAAIIFAVSHWCLRVSFLAEMNPSISLLKTVLAPSLLQTQDGWRSCLLTLWGQGVGLLLAILYAVSFAPKADKVWRPISPRAAAYQ